MFAACYVLEWEIRGRRGVLEVEGEWIREMVVGFLLPPVEGFERASREEALRT